MTKILQKLLVLSEAVTSNRLKLGKAAYKPFNDHIENLSKTDKKFQFSIDDGDDAQVDEWLYDPKTGSFFGSFTIEWSDGTGATNWFKIDKNKKVTKIRDSAIPESAIDASDDVPDLE